jgi:hypothetical protein
MILLAAILFALGAVLGLTAFIRWLTSKEAPRTVVYLHGLAGAIGIILLLLYASSNPESFPLVSIILFVAALGGFYLFFTDVKKKPHPLAAAGLHALLAVGGFVTLLLFIFR